MAEETKTTFPMLPSKSWGDLRRKFKQSMPDKVSVEYLASVLGIDKKSAQNLMPYLKTMGIIDEEGRTTPLANKWRLDENYVEVCKEILTRVYPKELLSAFPNPSENRRGVESWFAMKTGSGTVAVSRMSTLYTLLSEADINKGEKPSSGVVREKKVKLAKEPPSGRKKVPYPREEPESDVRVSQQTESMATMPSIHIDLQIHLSPEASPDQIDQIFASMAKHLKDLAQSHK